MFPERLTDLIVSQFSIQGDLVFDPFCGSGTTLVSAKTMGRNYLGVDINQQYVDMSFNRLSVNDYDSNRQKELRQNYSKMYF